MTSPNQTAQKSGSELHDLAALLADLKSKWPDLYRHIMGLIKAVNRGK